VITADVFSRGQTDRQTDRETTSNDRTPSRHSVKAGLHDV